MPIVDDIKKESSAYVKGAIVGGVIGSVFALATKRRLLILGGIGALVGGFIAHTMVKSGNESVNPKFKNYDAGKQ